MKRQRPLIDKTRTKVNRGILAGLLWLLTYPASLLHAQSFGPPSDSLKRDANGRYPTRWNASLDFRNSFINRQPVNVWGVNTGLVFGRKRNQFAVGYYWLSYSSYLRLIDWRKNAARRLNLDYYTRTNMAFINTLYWWNLIYNRKWTLSLPIEVGAGLSTAIPTNLRTDSLVGGPRNDFLMPINVGIYGEWKATRWIGLSAQLGYRHAVFRTNLKQNYNGIYYSVGTTLYAEAVEDAWRFLFKRKH